MQTVIKKKPIKRAAVLHDLCTVGKAAMTNILPVLSVMGIEACPVPTMVLSSHTGGFGKPVMYPLTEFPKQCGEHLKSCGFTFDAVLLGYLGNEANIRQAEAFLKEFPAKLVLFDPIMGDHGKFYSNFDETYLEALKTLIPYCSLMTPNYTEACLLAGEPYEEVCSEAKFHRIACRLEHLEKKQIVITSIPKENGTCAIGFLENGRRELFSYHSEGRAYPGTGDLFSAVLLGSLLNGESLQSSVRTAHGFVGNCIQESDKAGYDTKEGVLLETQLHQLITAGS